MAVHVGDTGVTESPLYLTGIVRVGGVRRTARSDRGPVEPGAPVVVVGDDPLGLVVRPVEPGRAAERLPDHGRRVFTSPHERAEAAEERLADAERRDWSAHRRRGAVRGALLGVLAAAGAGWVLWDRLAAEGDSPGLVAAVVGLAGAMWGALVFLSVDWAIGRVSQPHRRLAGAGTCLGLAAGAGAVIVGVPWLGREVGLLLAALATFGSAAVIPGSLAVLVSGE